MQLLVTNEGRKIFSSQSPSKSMAVTGGHKHKKKVVSKPIESLSSIVDGAGKGEAVTLAMTYEHTKQNQAALMHSEEARKKLRVERLKRHNA